MENKRKTISKKIRFEVFKRDSFTCQYCGRSAPEVILEIDHINPVINGGNNNIMNLITSCFDCNRGKGKRKLNENEELKLQIEQLKEINKKREQLEMLLKWKNEIENFENEQAEKIEEIFYNATGIGFSEYGSKKCIELIKKFGFEEVYESTKISINQYYNEYDPDSTTIVFNYIERICWMRRKQKNDPSLYKINYLCKIAKNNFHYFNEIQIKTLLKKFYKEEDFDDLKEIFSTSKNWTELKENLICYYEEEL